MLSTEVIADARAERDTAIESIGHLQNKIVALDGSKIMYDDAVVLLELSLLDELNEVNQAFEAVGDAYQDRIDADCRSDLFWAVQSFSATSGMNGTYTLVCKRLNSGGYAADDSGNTDGDDTESVGIGSTVNYVGVTGIITAYPANANYAADMDTGGDTGIVNDPYFGFERRNRYGLKIYEEPYGVDIGNTFVGNFIGTCKAGGNRVTVMSQAGVGLTFREGQLVSCAVTAIISGVNEIVGLSTNFIDLRAIPGIGTTGATVNVLELQNALGAGASAPQEDGTFVEFTVLDDPEEFKDEGLTKYAIDFTKNPFVPQTISIATTATVGQGVSIRLDNSGQNSNAKSWDPGLASLPPEADPVSEPQVGAGQEFWTVGFGHAPISGGSRAVEGQTLILDAPLNAFRMSTAYEKLSDCSSSLEDAITDAVGIASTKETELNDVDGDTQLKIDSINAMRGIRNDKQIQIFGVRKILGDMVDKTRKLDQLIDYIGFSTITSIIDR